MSRPDPDPAPPASTPDASVATRVAMLLDWFEREGRDWPWRRTRDRWIVLVSEVCLQQTQVARAAPAIERLLERFPSPGVLAQAPLGELLQLWQGLGYPRRARNLWLTARHLHEHGWPDDLRSLPGVGPYTDAAVRCFADEEAVLPPDINTRRVASRLFPEYTPTAVDEPLVAAHAWQWGQACMELGQVVCRARARCPECPLAIACPSAGTDEVIASPRQARFEGSLRQRRGRMLRRVVTDGYAIVADDDEACRTLVADQLAWLEERDGEEIIVTPGPMP